MKIGVIGAAGRIGRMRVQTIQENPKTQLAAVMDVNREAAAAVAPGVPSFSEVQAFFDVPMDAVAISTPPHVREAYCREAYARGLHVLTEKPLAHTLEASRNIVAAAEAAGRVLAGGFNMRYYPAFHHVKDVVLSGDLGEIDHVRVYGGHSGLSNFSHEWQYRTPASGGGTMWDVGIHMSDMARHILGDITKVYGVVSERVWKLPGSEDNAMAILHGPDGVNAIYQAAWSDWTGYSSVIEVYGSLGMVRGAYAPMDNLTITMAHPGGKAKTARNRYLDVKVNEKLKSWTHTAVRSFAAELVDFLDLVEGGSGGRIATAAECLGAIEVAVGVRESSASGQAVSLPLPA